MDTKTKTLQFPIPMPSADDDGFITVYPVHNHVPDGYHNRQPPKNNDGRKRCYWCDQPTKKRGLWGEYDICPECQK